MIIIRLWRVNLPRVHTEAVDTVGLGNARASDVPFHLISEHGPLLIKIYWLEYDFYNDKTLA